MRILQTVHDFLPDQVAGVEVYTDRLSRALLRDHEVAVLHAVLDPGREDHSVAESETEGLRAFSIVENRHFRRFEETYAQPRLRGALASVLDTFRPDIVHVQHLLNLSTELVSQARRRGVPVVMTLHDHWLACANGGQRFHPRLGDCDTLDSLRCGECTASQHGPLLGLRGAQQRRRAARDRGREDSGAASTGPAGQAALSAGVRRATQAALAPLRSWAAGAQAARIETRWQRLRALGDEIDRFFAPSRDIEQAFVAFGLPAASIVALPYGFPRDRFPRRAPLPQRAVRFGYLGSLVRHKGVHVLIEAFRELPPTLELMVAGSLRDDPAYCASLRAAADHPGIEFVGQIAPERVPEVLGGIDCLIAPSVWRENAPLVVQEAFACGIPVVASRIGGHVELLEKGGGVLLPPGDAAALALELRSLAEEPGRLRALAEQIPEIVDMDVHAGELAAHYADVIARRS